MKTELENRSLWYDGFLEIDPIDVLKYIKYDKICVPYITEDIKQFNMVSENKIEIKSKLDVLDTTWNIPSEYLDVDIESYIMDKFVDVEKDLGDQEILERYKRIKEELIVFNRLNLYDLLKTMVYLIDMFKKYKIVWGVGRGSSVSSYILYLLEVHDIDSMQYELDFNDFLSLE
jgi:DNA polymerase III alpha subunit